MPKIQFDSKVANVIALTLLTTYFLSSESNNGRQLWIENVYTKCF